MAKFCPNCGGQASDSATNCPLCNCSFADSTSEVLETELNVPKNNFKDPAMVKQNLMNPQPMPKQQQPATPPAPKTAPPQPKEQKEFYTRNAENAYNSSSLMQSMTEDRDVPDLRDQKEPLLYVLCYFWLFSLVPYFRNDGDNFILYHATQGLNLAVISLSASILVKIIVKITGLTFINMLSLPIVLAEIVFSLLGIYYAVKGEVKPLPYISKVKIFK